MPQPRKIHRNEAVVKLVNKKVKYTDIAKQFRITKGRVAQIVKENKVNSGV